MAVKANSTINLKDALNAYTSSNGSMADVDYFDPFKLPENMQPTYEAGRDHIIFGTHEKIAGYSTKDFKDLEDLWDLMLPEDLDRNIRLALAALHFRHCPENTPSALLYFQLESCFRMKGKHGKLYYYHRKSNENGMLNSRMYSVVSYWEDISFMTGGRNFCWHLTARNAEFFDFNIPEVKRYQGVLSAREVEILRLVARGLTSSDVSRLLKIAKNTVDTHRRNMLRKLEVANTPELVDMARDMNIIV